ncbi:hypothetical protein KIPB_014813 [Kipferlia bialata]|uniref:Uncharacterized protein n=1 Tax=Kipferlia bialata TaxID=797122 RepID=A0A391NVL7_9EUKA|nr:hypothetical protein KIPB_014813 [Kipferlia bialata]|eukprot:g14813.t1
MNIKKISAKHGKKKKKSVKKRAVRLTAAFDVDDANDGEEMGPVITVSSNSGRGRPVPQSAMVDAPTHTATALVDGGDGAREQVSEEQALKQVCIHYFRNPHTHMCL